MALQWQCFGFYFFLSFGGRAWVEDVTPPGLVFPRAGRNEKKNLKIGYDTLGYFVLGTNLLVWSQFPPGLSIAIARKSRLDSCHW